MIGTHHNGRVGMWGAALASLLGIGVVGCLAAEPYPRTQSETSGNEAGDGDPTTSDSGEADTGETGSDVDLGTTDGDGYDGVTCEQSLCLDPELCCASMAASTCKSSCDVGEVGLTCDGPEDCAGGVCCLGLTGGSSCAATMTDCPASQPQVACHTLDDCDSGECSPHVFVSWISLCG